MVLDDSTITYKGMALYDPVRFQYFKRFEDALNNYQECIKQISGGFVPNNTYTFVAKVASLYVEIFPKLEYNESKLKDNLAHIENSLVTGVFEPRKQLSSDIHLKVEKAAERNVLALFLEYSSYFLQLRQFLEQNGITSYEVKKYDEAEEPIRDLARG
jgi:hypothetical protein